MTSTPRRLAAVVLLAVPALLLVGCSATSGAAGGSEAQASAKAIASAVASAQGRTEAPKAAAASGPISTGDQLCKLVPLGDAQAAVKASPVLAQQQAGSGPDDEPGCGFASTDTKVILSVFLYPLKDNPFDGTRPVMSMDPLTAVPGLGEKAGINKDELDVLKGDTVVSVETVGSVDMTKDQMIAMGRLIVSRLP